MDGCEEGGGWGCGDGEGEGDTEVDGEVAWEFWGGEGMEGEGGGERGGCEWRFGTGGRGWIWGIWEG